MLNLEQYYNENHWQGLLYLADKYWIDSSDQLRLLDIVNDIEIAKVIWGRLRNNCFDWLTMSRLDLDNLKPIDCVNDANLKKRLKTVLIRFD